MSRLSFDELPVALKKKLMAGNPELSREYDANIERSRIPLEEACQRTESYMLEHGEIPGMNEFLEACRAFLRKDILAEELLQAVERFNDGDNRTES